MSAETVTPYKSETESKKQQVATMFNNIAFRYDMLNQVLSAGTHHKWRRKAVKEFIDAKPKMILDIATGTGDFAIAALASNPEKVIGVDISEGMLKFGVEKIWRSAESYHCLLRQEMYEANPLPSELAGPGSFRSYL